MSRLEGTYSFLSSRVTSTHHLIATDAEVMPGGSEMSCIGTPVVVKVASLRESLTNATVSAVLHCARLDYCNLHVVIPHGILSAGDALM